MGACSARMQGTVRTVFFCILEAFPDLIPDHALDEQGYANRTSQSCAISLDFPNEYLLTNSSGFSRSLMNIFALPLKGTDWD